MKYGLIHYNIEGTAEEVVRWAADAGFDAIEISHKDIWPGGTDEPEKAAEALRKVMDEAGIEASALASGNDFAVLDPEVVKAQVERMERLAGVAKILGTNVFRTEGGRPKDEVPPERHVEAMAGCLERCLDFAERLDVYFAVDNHGTITNDADLQLELFERVGSKRVGSNLDTMNYRWMGHDLETCNRFYDIIAPYVLHTHLKDGRGARADYKGTGLGEGEIDLAHAVRALKKAGYKGVWCAEFEDKTVDGRTGYAQCLEWMKTNIPKI